MATVLNGSFVSFRMSVNSISLWPAFYNKLKYDNLCLIEPWDEPNPVYINKYGLWPLLWMLSYPMLTDGCRSIDIRLHWGRGGSTAHHLHPRYIHNDCRLHHVSLSPPELMDMHRKKHVWYYYIIDVATHTKDGGVTSHTFVRIVSKDVELERFLFTPTFLSTLTRWQIQGRIALQRTYKYRRSIPLSEATLGIYPVPIPHQWWSGMGT